LHTSKNQHSKSADSRQAKLWKMPYFALLKNPAKSSQMCGGTTSYCSSDDLYLQRVPVWATPPLESYFYHWTQCWIGVQGFIGSVRGTRTKRAWNMTTTYDLE